ncbi:hypothetical protein J437_LFUL002016 [Ladona fulva]|uniref:Uncharacterized protein n=1 Tax=Ladona fulva TaxID=123851 RepID=A0A8K0NV79_LADFU|nr:hypothetical protein J437_LFUL002016 [Ladona fulva]
MVFTSKLRAQQLVRRNTQFNHILVDDSRSKIQALLESPMTSGDFDDVIKVLRPCLPAERGTPGIIFSDTEFLEKRGSTRTVISMDPSPPKAPPPPPPLAPPPSAFSPPEAPPPRPSALPSAPRPDPCWPPALAPGFPSLFLLCCLSSSSSSSNTWSFGRRAFKIVGCFGATPIANGGSTLLAVRLAYACKVSLPPPESQHGTPISANDITTSPINTSVLPDNSQYDCALPPTSVITRKRLTTLSDRGGSPEKSKHCRKTVVDSLLVRKNNSRSFSHESTRRSGRAESPGREVTSGTGNSLAGHSLPPGSSLSRGPSLGGVTVGPSSSSPLRGLPPLGLAGGRNPSSIPL